MMSDKYVLPIILVGVLLGFVIIARYKLQEHENPVADCRIRNGTPLVTADRKIICVKVVLQ